MRINDKAHVFLLGAVAQTLEIEPIRIQGLVVDHAASTAFQISGSLLYLMRTNDLGANLRQSLRGSEANPASTARDHSETMIQPQPFHAYTSRSCHWRRHAGASVTRDGLIILLVHIYAHKAPTSSRLK
jgi:hypothetical protein